MTPWADVLYAADLRWWRQNVRELQFDGLRVCPTAEAAVFDRRIHVAPFKWRDRDRCEQSMEMEFGPAGEIGGGGNSGFQAVNLAAQFGARRIVLLGFDMCIVPRGKLHHHGAHSSPMRNPTERLLAEWAKTLNGQAAALEAHGVEVVNASRNSALAAFPKMNVQEIVAQWRARPSQAA